MARFFVSSENIDDNIITIKSNDSYHIARSLRMAVGDEVTVCDESGTEYLCTLTRIRDEECSAEIISKKAGATEPPVEITLYMAYPKGDKLETVVQKSVELGASVIVPFESSRCIKRPAEDKLDKITDRLNRIAEEAAKQCGRSRLPSVSRMIKFSELLTRIGGYDLTLFCYEGEGTESLKKVLGGYGKDGGRIAVIIGSEGGFSESEAKSITDAGAKCVNLGPRILRCETAPDYCLAAISYHFEL
ncbi:MAG: 16S rRNA (uracil(1498)-N(3))-methyltransferase [Clostridia bacterium]|nr:16S rRNA (uracil(1498)-N(3))-methyltransferase [Clostridia bacterium]